MSTAPGDRLGVLSRRDRHWIAAAVAMASALGALVWLKFGIGTSPLVPAPQPAASVPVEGGAARQADAPNAPRELAPTIEPAPVAEKPPAPDVVPAPIEFSQLAAMHGQPAPAEYQAKAHEWFVGYAAELRRRLATAKPTSDWKAVLAEADTRTSLRLVELCAEQAATGAGLLLVSGLQDLPPVRYWMTVTNVGVALGRNLHVTTRIEPHDPELTRLDAAYQDLRALHITELLLPFNGLSFDTRRQRIGRYEQERRYGSGERTETFGLPSELLIHIEIEPLTMTVLPRQRQ